MTIAFNPETGVYEIRLATNLIGTADTLREAELFWEGWGNYVRGALRREDTAKGWDAAAARQGATVTKEESFR